MIDSLKNEILEHITTEIAIGFLTAPEIFDSIQDTFLNEALDETWILKTIEEKFAANLEKSSTWQHPTDFDKLVVIFNNLIDNGIVALHNAGYTRQDAISECESLIEELDFFASKIKGYCYYHTQDIERIIFGSAMLYIGFGGYPNKEELAVTVANKIVEECKNAGFTVQWDGKVDTRIVIAKFNWQKIPDKTDYNYKNIFNRLKHLKKAKSTEKSNRKLFWKFWKL